MFIFLRRKFIIGMRLIFCGIVLVACRAIVQEPTTITSIPTNETATVTMQAVSPTTTAYSTAAAVLPTRMPLNCAKILDTPPDNAPLRGYTVTCQVSGCNLIDAPSGKIIKNIANAEEFDWATYVLKVSPDYRWAYIDTREGKVCRKRLVSLGSSSTICLDEMIPSWSGVEWINNEWLHIRHRNREADIPDQDWLINPFNGQKREIEEDEYPDLYDGAWEFQDRFLKFSPDFSRVLYLANDQMDKPYLGTYTLVLWDIEQQKELSRLPFSSNNTFLSAYYEQCQQWSLDGEEWILVRAQNPVNIVAEKVIDKPVYDIALMDRNGNLLAQTPESFARIIKIALSPDGTKVAFLYEADLQSHRLNVGVWNWKTGEIKSSCFRGKDALGYSEELIWSPDSKYLAFATRKDENPYVPDNPSKVWLWNADSNEVAPWFEGRVNLDAWYEPAQ